MSINKYLIKYIFLILLIILIFIIINDIININVSKIFKISYETFFKSIHSFIPNISFKKSNNNALFIINDYKLFNISENPFITFVMNISDSHMFNKTLFDFFKVIYKETHIDIQVIFINNSSSDLLKIKEIKTFITEKKIEIYKFENKSYRESFLEIMKRIKGKFFILFDKNLKFHKEDFDIIYRITKGSN